MSKLNLKNVVWKEGKFFVAQCLNVDVSSFGKTEKEAIENLDEAVSLYLEDNPSPNIIEVEEPKIVKFSLEHA